MTEAVSEHQDFLCDGCGVTDNHPMVHVAYARWQKDARTSILEPSFHFDCLPAEFIPPVEPQHANLHSTIEEAQSGVKGDDLRAFILTLPDDNNITPDEAAPDA